MNILKCSLLLVSCFAVSLSLPVSQPVYSSQYISAQALPEGVQYRQAYVQPQYIQQQAVNRPVYEGARTQGLQQYSTQAQPDSQQPIQQILVSSNVDRQIQRVAQLAGPLFLQQIQAAQQQGQTQEALAASQRKTTSQTFARRTQPVILQQPQQQQQQQQVQYVREASPTPRYSRPQPSAAGYRQVQESRAQQQQREQEEKEEDLDDYDPNPSYQFGFDVKDDLYTNYQNRKEQRDGNKITGSYSVVDSDGFVRTVTYTADPKEGFKAEVTRQPTDIVVKIPKPDPQFAKQPTKYVQAAPPQRVQYVQAVPVQRGQQYVQAVPVPKQGHQKSNVVYQYQ